MPTLNPYPAAIPYRPGDFVYQPDLVGCPAATCVELTKTVPPTWGAPRSEDDWFALMELNGIRQWVRAEFWRFAGAPSRRITLNRRTETA